MNNEQLQSLVKKVSLRFFGMNFNHEATFNRRLRTTGGRYLLQSHNIELNPKYYEERGEEELIGIIKHELCHYHLHIQGKGYKHRDADFRYLLQKVDAPRFCKPLESVARQRQVSKHKYKCKGCGQTYDRKRRIDVNRFVCGKCSGKLFLL